MLHLKKSFLQKVSRRKRQSRSSSQNSSGGTTPITSTPVSTEKKIGQLHEDTTEPYGGRAITLLDDNSEAPSSAGKNCDNHYKKDTSVARNKGTLECQSRLVADSVQRQGGPGENTVPVSNTQPSGVEAEKAEDSNDEGAENDGTRMEPKVVLRQNVSSKNSEKRVSFTDITEAEMNNKTMHK